MENAFELKIKDKMPAMQHVILEYHREFCRPEISGEFLEYLDKCRLGEMSRSLSFETPAIDELIKKYLETHKKKK